MRHKDGTRAAERRRQYVRQMQQNQRNETKRLRSSKTAIAGNKVMEAVAAEAVVAEPAVTGKAAAAEAATVGITEVRVSEVVERRSVGGVGAMNQNAVDAADGCSASGEAKLV